MAIKNRLFNLMKYRKIQFPKSIHDPSELDWPDGWHALHYDDIPKLTRELNREVCKEHILYHVPACALGRKSNTDDFLFQVETGEYTFASVHLTWRKEKDPAWPHTKLYNGFQEWRDDKAAEPGAAV